jgi:predicted ATPase/DNA-binding CsgD family transcriptional regulator
MMTSDARLGRSMGRELTIARLSPMIGRRAELASLRAALRSARLVTVTGPGGVGKTRLALAALEAGPGASSDGSAASSAAIELASLADGGAIAERVLGVLGGRVEAGVEPVEALVAHLNSQPMTILLDNCEHLRRDAARLCERLLLGASEVRVLATSREPLGVAGEVVFALEPLSLGGSGDAVALFLDRAARASRTFTAGPEALATIAGLCAQLDGLPLAIELAAARTRVIELERIATDLARRLDFLGDAGDQVARHRSLRASMEWSCALLRGPERTLFERLSVFAGGWDLDAAEAVCADDALPREAILEAMSALVDRSLIVQDATSAGAHLTMLSTVRAYAGEALARSDREDSIAAAHACWCAELVDSAERRLVSGESAGALRMLDANADNIAAATRHAAVRDPVLAVRIAVGAALWRDARGRFTEGARTLAQLLPACEDCPEDLRARALWAHGLALVAGGELALAAPVVREAVQRARDLGDDALLARALTLHAELQLMAEPGTAIPALQQAVELAGGAGDRWCLADALGKLGAAALYRSDARAAEPPLRESLAIAREAGDEQAIHRALGGLARVTAIGGEAEEAITLLLQGLAISERLGDRGWITRDLAMLGELERIAGRPEAGEDHAQRALAIADEIAAAYPRCLATGILGRIALTRGDLNAAERRFARAAEIADAAGVRPFATWWRLGLAEVALARSDLEAARTHALGALELAQAIENRRDAGRATLLLGLVALASRDLDVAVAQLIAALGEAHDLADATAARRALEALLEVYARTDQSDRAERVRTAMRDPARGLGDAIALVMRGRGSRRREPELGWGGLTPAEAQVAELAATGISNPEIGERLFMSRSTVKTHLSRVYAKLSVANRTELAAALAAEHARMPR